MKIEANLSKKYFFILLGAILILAGAIYGYAYGGSTPSVMGHSGNEINVLVDGETKLLNDALSELSSEGVGSVTFDKMVSWDDDAGPFVLSSTGDPVTSRFATIDNPIQNIAPGPAYLTGRFHQSYAHSGQIYVRKIGTGDEDWILSVNVYNNVNGAHNIHDVQTGVIIPSGYEFYTTYNHIDWLSVTWGSGEGSVGGGSSESFGNLETYIDYDNCSQIEFTTGDQDNWLANTCPTDMVLVGGAGCGGNFCGGLRYARCCKLSSGSGSGGGAEVGSPAGTLCGMAPWGSGENEDNAAKCNGVTLPDCPEGYTYQYFQMSHKSRWGSCIKN